MWESYVEAMKLESAGFTVIEIEERLKLDEIEQLKGEAALMNALFSFKCISEERLIEANGNSLKANNQ